MQVLEKIGATIAGLAFIVAVACVGCVPVRRDEAKEAGTSQATDVKLVAKVQGSFEVYRFCDQGRWVYVHNHGGLAISQSVGVNCAEEAGQ